MSKLRKPNGTFMKKDGEIPNQESNPSLLEDPNSTQEYLSQNKTSSTTIGTQGPSENIVVLYPLEKDEAKSVKTIVSNIEKIKDENLPPESSENPPPTDPMTTLLMNLQKNIQESNEVHARDIKSEIGGLRTKIDENNLDMTNKINGLKTTMDQNAAEFRTEISRIDKRLDEHESETTNIINKARCY